MAAMVAVGTSYFFLKRSVPDQGNVVATQAISTTGVQMDLMSIAQAERLYVAQNGNYGTLDQLTSSGAMNLTRTERDGYTYAVAVSSDGFLATATHADLPATPSAPGLHYPTITVDQTLQVRQGD